MRTNIYIWWDHSSAVIHILHFKLSITIRENNMLKICNAEVNPIEVWKLAV